MQAALLGTDGTSPLWLTREKDVIAHLFFAAAEIGIAEVDVGGLAVTATLSFPNIEARVFSVFVKKGTEIAGGPPEPGAVVQVRYHRGDAVYSFLTDLREVVDGRQWRLDIPRTIERNERRIVDRHRVLARGGFRIRVLDPDGRSRALPLFDLSTAGVGVIFDPARMTLALGAAFAATVCLPDGTALPALLEVRNLRELPGGSGEKVAGCTFVGVSAADLGRLARAVADARRRAR